MKKYLPLGSVVILKGTEKKLMIIGRYQMVKEDIFDYSACLFPEGYLGKDKLYVFNQENIQEVYYLGMQNQEEFVFRQKMQEAIQEKSFSLLHN